MSPSTRSIALYALTVFVGSVLLPGSVTPTPWRCGCRRAVLLATAMIPALPVLTDDRVPVESLMASLFLSGLGK